MKIKNGCEASTAEFWYDLKEGYLKPEEILADKADIKRVKDALKTILDFENSCADAIEGFYR